MSKGLTKDADGNVLYVIVYCKYGGRCVLEGRKRTSTLEPMAQARALRTTADLPQTVTRRGFLERQGGALPRGASWTLTTVLGKVCTAQPTFPVFLAATKPAVFPTHS